MGVSVKMLSEHSSKQPNYNKNQNIFTEENVEQARRDVLQPFGLEIPGKDESDTRCQESHLLALVPVPQVNPCGSPGSMPSSDCPIAMCHVSRWIRLVGLGSATCTGGKLVSKRPSPGSPDVPVDITTGFAVAGNTDFCHAVAHLPQQNNNYCLLQLLSLEALELDPLRVQRNRAGREVLSKGASFHLK